MRDVELYRAILGLTSPWTVVGVELDVTAQRVVVKVDAGGGPFACPECGAEGPRYDRKPRRWRHLDTMQFTTWIEADVPRVECAAHGVRQIRIPWAAPGSQFTALFERLAIDLLRECSVTGAGRLLRITWDEAWGHQRAGGCRRGRLHADGRDLAPTLQDGPWSTRRSPGTSSTTRTSSSSSRASGPGWSRRSGWRSGRSPRCRTGDQDHRPAAARHEARLRRLMNAKAKRKRRAKPAPTASAVERVAELAALDLDAKAVAVLKLSPQAMLAFEHLRSEALGHGL